MRYGDFLSQVIDDGIEAARHDYYKPSQNHKLLGSINGFEECRDRTPQQLKALLQEAHQTTMEKRDADAYDYWYWRCREIEIEWVCNVVSAMLHSQGLPPIVAVTVRGTIKAVHVMGIDLGA